VKYANTMKNNVQVAVQMLIKLHRVDFNFLKNNNTIILLIDDKLISLMSAFVNFEKTQAARSANRNNAETFKRHNHIHLVKAQYSAIIKDIPTEDLERSKQEINQELNERSIN
jgi:hypothetical protein